MSLSLEVYCLVITAITQALTIGHDRLDSQKETKEPSPLLKDAREKKAPPFIDRNR
ncbi:hypothetical protein [Paenibacillus dokdonensis]|uniref:hypothetical protein n=1 Tax=Paenibacillus dokdonensis TaxID=2567944 RepID=UPI001457C1D3|nr:hypothetical protein [Paenibacillus dokdonensis]